jgi:antitoxin ParD1/3/4
MNVLVSPRFEALIRQKVELGPYSDAAEVVEEALTLLDNRDRLKQLRQSLIEADEAIERGEGSEWSPELKERIRERGNEMFRKGIKPSPDVCP